MRKLFILLTLAAGSGHAAPVSLTLEVVKFYDILNNFADSPATELSHYSICEAGGFPPIGGASCNHFERESERSHNYGSDGADGGAITAWHFESTVTSSDTSFSLQASSFVSATAWIDIEQSLPESEIGTNPYATAYVNQNSYLVEFTITEAVRYEGSFSLSDVLFTGSNEFGDAGTIFDSGSVLGPGVYQYWGPTRGYLSAPPIYPETDWVIAYKGETIVDTSYQEFEFHFTVVPIPAAAWLFGSALFWLGWFRTSK